MFSFGNKIEKTAKQILEIFDEGIMIFDKKMNLVFINKKAEEVFGYKAKEVIGKSIDIFIPERFCIQHSMFVEEFAKNKDVLVKTMGERTRKTYGIHKNGEEFLTNLTIMHTDVAGKYFVTVIKDSTKTISSDRELIRMAITDPLTGALNKAEFMFIAEKETLRSKRYSTPFCVVLIKVDTFEELNDKYGYSIGDRAIQWVSNICCNTLRNVDVFGRWDSSRFSVLLPETSLSGAEIISSRLTKLIADNNFEKGGNIVDVTISAGVAEYDDTKTSLEEAMNNANLALEDAIAKGGNNTSVFSGRIKTKI